MSSSYPPSYRNVHADWSTPHRMKMSVDVGKPSGVGDLLAVALKRHYCLGRSHPALHRGESKTWSLPYGTCSCSRLRPVTLDRHGHMGWQWPTDDQWPP